MKTKIFAMILMLVFSLVPIMSVLGSQPLAGPNFMGFTPDVTDVTVGDSFNVTAWVDVNSAIDTASIDNLTFLPAGVVNYDTTTQGDLFGGSLVWITPEGGGTIDNITGYAKPITWAYTTNVTGVNGTLATLHMTSVSCGVATLTIASGGTALGGIDPGTTKYTATINVHPESTGSFDAVDFNFTQIDLSWVKFTGDDRVVIRYNTVGPAPTDPSSDTLLYNDTGTSTSHTNLTSGDHIYYSIWGYNDTANLYSLYFQSDDARVPYPNLPPVFGTPTPVNGSINQSLAFIWRIPITDPDGDMFNWTIECSNNQNSSANNAVNGTESLPLSGLAYNTTYTIWVNATDGTDWNRSWYTFTTKNQNTEGTPGIVTPTAVTPTAVAPVTDYTLWIIAGAIIFLVICLYFWRKK